VWFVGADLAVGTCPLVESRSFGFGPWASFLGIPVAGLLWSLAVLTLNSAHLTELKVGAIEAFFLVSMGGVAQTAALWIGFSIVAWAMIRAFWGRASLIQLLVRVSETTVALWIAIPVVAYQLYAEEPETALTIIVLGVSGVAFLTLLARSLSQDLGWTLARAMAPILSTLIFLVSFVFLAS